MPIRRDPVRCAPCRRRGIDGHLKHRTCGLRIRTSRFILPGHQTCHSPRWETEQLLADFDKVFAMLDGWREPEVSLRRALEDRFKDLWTGERIASTYFDLRFFPGIGTIHVFARDKGIADHLHPS